MASSSIIGAMCEFDERREEVNSYLERLEQWMLANAIGEPTPAGTADRRVSVLLATTTKAGRIKAINGS